MAFEHARGRLRAAAGRWKERHGQHAQHLPLQVGQLVYLRDLGVRGRHKLHDKWSSVIYQVLRAPSGDGMVYTIAPVEELHRAWQVHRDMLKPQVLSSVQPPRAQSPPVQTAPGDSFDSSEDGELWLLTRETSAPLSIEAPVQPRSMGPAVTTPLVASPDPGPSLEAARFHSGAASSAGQPSPSQPVLRRTGRYTAGQHPNVHHLPQPVAIRGNRELAPAQPVVNGQSVLFRPWS